MRAARLCAPLVVALGLIGLQPACSQPPPAAPTPPPTILSAPVPAAPRSQPGHTVSGTVLDGAASEPRAVPVSFVDYLVDSGSALGRVPVDANGRYTIPNVPGGSRIRVTAIGTSLKQTCGAYALVEGDTSLDIDLVRPGTRGRRHRTPTLSGVVFETTAAGRRPVAATPVVYYSVFRGTFDVYTITDAEGRYEFCGLPLGAGDLLAGSCNDQMMPVPIELRSDSTNVDVDLTPWIRACELIR